MIRSFVAAFLFLVWSIAAAAQSYITLNDVPYAANPADEYAAERCVLDIYYPAQGDGFATVVWFHGGGLTGGNKSVPGPLKDKGIAVVAPNYRLSPKTEAPGYFLDAAAAVAWVFENIASYGGDPSRIYVAGHSAGGYLGSMLALDKTWLEGFGVDADNVKGWMPVSGQAATHWQVLRERGNHEQVPVVDSFAPLSHVRPDTPRIILTAGQSDLEMANRTVENRYLYDALRTVGNENVEFYELNGFDHNTVVAPSLHLLLKMIAEN